MLIQHPHDHFVREFFSDLNQAREFLAAALPAALAETLDWNSLRSEPASFIDENLREQYSDLLFSVADRAGGRRRIYVLFEHKSVVEGRLLWQLLGYLARIYAGLAEPAPVIPLVFYHGVATHPHQRLLDLLALTPEQQALYRPYVPDFGYVLYDLGQAGPQQWGSLALQVFLAALDGARRQDRQRIAGALRLAERLLREPEGTRIVHAMLVYLFHVTDLEPAHLRALLAPAPTPELEATMMTAAQKLFEGGKLEGRLEGKLEGEAAMLATQLEVKFGVIPERYRQRMAGADAETLLAWGKRLLSAASLEEVFGAGVRREA